MTLKYNLRQIIKVHKKDKKDIMNEESKKDYGVLIAKKSEKLVTALYLVMDLMVDNEPIKHSIHILDQSF